MTDDKHVDARKKQQSARRSAVGQIGWIQFDEALPPLGVDVAVLIPEGAAIRRLVSQMEFGHPGDTEPRAALVLEGASDGYTLEGVIRRGGFWRHLPDGFDAPDPAR